MPFSGREIHLLLSPFLQDLPLGHILVLSGIPHLPAGTAVMLPELGWPSPWPQVIPFSSQCLWDSG